MDDGRVPGGRVDDRPGCCGRGGVAGDGRGLTGVVVRDLVLFELALVPVAAVADRADEGLLAGVYADMRDEPLASKKSLAASFASENKTSNVSS